MEELLWRPDLGSGANLSLGDVEVELVLGERADPSE
jgi:hypothetical protein